MLLFAVLLAACGDKPKTYERPRANRAILFVQLVNKNATCYAVATPDASTPGVDTAYCALDQDVLWVEAPLASPPKAAKIGRRNAEKPAEISK